MEKEGKNPLRKRLHSVYIFLSSGKVLPIIILVILPAFTILLLYTIGIVDNPLYLISVIIMLVLYAPYRAADPSEKYFKRRGHENAINDYHVTKHILYVAVPMFIFFAILPYMTIIKSIVDALIPPDMVYLITLFSFWIVISGLLKIIIQVAKKDFRLNFAIGCIRVLAREGNEIDRMKYTIWGLNAYNSYLRRYLKLEIGKLKKIYSLISSLPLTERIGFMNSLAVSFDIDKLEPLQVLSKYLNPEDREQLLVKESLQRKIKEAAAFIAVVVPIMIAVLQASGIMPGAGGG